MKLTDNETTRQGYFEIIVFKEKTALRAISGTAVLGFEGESLADVFVEVFKFDSKMKKEIRVQGCRTGTSGKFYFPTLAKGKYTIRLSKDGGFKITEIRVEVSPKSKHMKEIRATVQVGT